MQKVCKKGDAKCSVSRGLARNSFRKSRCDAQKESAYKEYYQRLKGDYELARRLNSVGSIDTQKFKNIYRGRKIHPAHNRDSIDAYADLIKDRSGLLVSHGKGWKLTADEKQEMVTYAKSLEAFANSYSDRKVKDVTKDHRVLNPRTWQGKVKRAQLAKEYMDTVSLDAKASLFEIVGKIQRLHF
ncbi:MAG: hypothetical protein ISR65_10570 [Bacteriovoracaceae bacterium]|nr:hypothetical protein [Bacteriovoracaceae bacterium]